MPMIEHYTVKVQVEVQVGSVESLGTCIDEVAERIAAGLKEKPALAQYGWEPKVVSVEAERT